MRIWLAIMLMLATVAMLAGCGGDDDEAGDTAGQTTAAALADGGEEMDEPDAEETDEPEATDEPDNGGGSVAIDPCELVTMDEAADAIGGATEEPVLTPDIGEEFSQCLWRIQGGTDIDPALVVQARADTSSDKYDELVESNCPEELGGAGPVDGIGDAAHECIVLLVLSGDVMFGVTVISNRNDVDSDLAKQEELAGTIIGRLP